MLATGYLLLTCWCGGLGVHAEERNGNVVANMGSGTLAGYVDTSAVWQEQHPHGLKRLFATYFRWMRIHFHRDS
jgi:hypothetical protein